jgi:hypothetical protein
MSSKSVSKNYKVGTPNNKSEQFSKEYADEYVEKL